MKPRARHQKNRVGTNQLEFDELVAEAIRASKGPLAARNANRTMALRRLKRLQELRRISNEGVVYDHKWMLTVKAEIQRASSLRAGVILTASRVSELLDLEIDRDHYDPEWKLQYDGFCRINLEAVGTPEDEADEFMRETWKDCAALFSLYYRINDISDWALFETLSSGDWESQEPATSSKEIAALESLVATLECVHVLVTGLEPLDDTDTRELSNI